jgi:hypothetical protein
MTDPTLPPLQKGKDNTLPPTPPLNEQEKFEDIFKSVDVDSELTKDTPVTTTPKQVNKQVSVPTQTEPNTATEGPSVEIVPTVAGFVPPPTEPKLTGIKDIGSYIAKAKENQSKKATRLEAEDGTNLTKLPDIYAVVPHTKGDHKLIYMVGKEPAWLIDDPKKRVPGTGYFKNNELIYDVWVTMKKHPTLKNERNEPLDVWLIDTPDQLTQQLASIAIGKWGGTNFSTPVICKKEIPTPSPVAKAPAKRTGKEEGLRDKKATAKSPTLPGAQATVTQTQPPTPTKTEEPKKWLSPEAKKTIRDTMAEKEKWSTIPTSLPKHFPSKKELQQPQETKKEDVQPAVWPQTKSTAKQLDTPPTPPPKTTPPKKPDLLPPPKKEVAPAPTVAVAQDVIVEEEKKQPSKETEKLSNEINLAPVSAESAVASARKEEIRQQTPLPNEVTLTQATQENAQVNSVVEQVTGIVSPVIDAPQEELVLPTEHKETYDDIVDLDSLDTPEEKSEVKEETKPTIDLGWLDAQFSPSAKKVTTHPKWSAFPLGTVFRIIGVIVVIGMSRAMYTVMFPTVPQRPTTDTTPTTGETLPDTPVGIVDEDTTDTPLTWSDESQTGTSGMPIKEEIEWPTPPSSGTNFTLDELKAKLTTQQKEGQTLANKAKLLNDKDAIKFSIVSIRKAGEALKRIEEDPTITAEELTDIATKIDLYLQEAQLRIQ